VSLYRIKFKGGPNLERKANFFADYFNHLNKNLGKYSYLEFETPLSLCSKVVFQIENNFEKSFQYLSHHFKHGYFKANDFTNSFKYYKDLRPLIDEYLGNEGKSNRDQWIKDTPEFLRILNRYIDELESRQIQVATEILIGLLGCSHELDEKHKESIIYLTQVIVSDLRFSNKREQGIKDLIQRIMSSDKDIFPLPQKILSRKYEANYDEIVTTYLKRRNFKTQFRGIINFKENDKYAGYNLIRIHKLQLPVDKSIKYENVEIFNPNNKKLGEIKAKSQEKDVKILSSEAFVNTKDTSIAVAEGLWNDKRTLRQSIIRVQRAIDHINLKLGLNSYLDPYEIRWTSNFEGMNYLGKPNKIELSEDDIEKMKDDNLFELLNDNPSNAAKRLLLAEKFYIRALISNDVSDYWQYIECIIPIKKRRKSICASILILCYRKYFKYHIADDLLVLLANHSASSEKTENHFSRLETDILCSEYSPESILKKSRCFSQHPIISELINIYNQKNFDDKIKSEYKYFYSIFHELYEIRNSYIHEGVTNEYAERKLSLLIPIFIEKIRWEIFIEVKKYKRMEIEKVIDKILTKSKKYCPYKVENGEIYEINYPYKIEEGKIVKII